MENVQTNVPFFNWFHAYLTRYEIPYPWSIGLMEDLSVNVLTVWHRKDETLVKSDLPPQSSFFLGKKDNSGKPVIASPFKSKVDDEPIGPQDI